MPLLDVTDIQGNVIAGYHTTHARYLFFAFDRVDPSLRNWLRSLAPTDARVRVSPNVATRNVAFTAAGMIKLGLPHDAIQALPLAFRAGMRARARQIGDIGASSPARWERWCRAEIDALVTVTGWTSAACDAEVERLTKRYRRVSRIRYVPTGATRPRHVQSGTALDSGLEPFVEPPEPGDARHEHFGFRDGLSNPVIEGAERRLAPGDGTRRGGRWTPMKAGEFLLGYEDETRVVDLARPLRPFFRNGSYMVWRKLWQDVDGFRDHVTDDEAIAARMIGRWRDGTPLALSPDRPSARCSNDFTFGGDPQGRLCPVSAHIRRANPRDALDFADEIVGRHRIIRRGMPYEDRPGQQGLIFVCYNADIERQFEFVQQRWIIDDPARTLDGHPDPLAAPNTGDGLASYVTTRAGEYFFQPGLLGLANLLRAADPTRR